MKHLAAREGPATIWIELTSKCPLRCIFCSRENLRGDGEHMESTMLECLLDSLERPEIIRLNYSGESANYPGLIEAIAKAKTTTHAHLEMVTSLVTMPMETVRRLPGSGIDRISISLHTLNERNFPVLYGGGSLDSFRRRLNTLVQASRLEATPPQIDFAMVAMQSNVSELTALSSFAAGYGAYSFSVHPVIRRNGVPPLFQIETGESGELTGPFQRALESEVRTARDANPGVDVSVARPPDSISPSDRFTCEQNPFETAHVLSNGDVVACEVMDRSALGNVKQANFDDIWRGPAYADLRTRYARNEIPACGTCVFRTAVGEVGAVRTSWGWHARDSSGALWSRTTCSFECVGDRSQILVVTGLLPPGLESNQIEFTRDGQLIAVGRNDTDQPLAFRIDLALASQQTNTFIARTAYGFSPWRRGLSNDTRELGFALYAADFTARTETEQQRTLQSESVSARVPRRRNAALKRKAAEFLLDLLRPLETLAPSQGLPVPVANRLPEDSLGIIIPERGAPAMLAACIAALKAALAKVTIRAEVAVVINGSAASLYADLMAAYPEFHFIFVRRPLGFTAAVHTGLRKITAGWTYLLNSDVLLDEHALSAVLSHRSPAVFSLASKINMTNPDSEWETNRTGIEFVDGLVNLVELDGNICGPVDHFYSGGGSSLFQTALLRFFIQRTSCYDPFYWEDAEWGHCARAMGLRNVFIPESSVDHVGKATVRRFYQPSEVSRIFERNRIQFQLRCVPGRNMEPIRERLCYAPWQTIYELLQPPRIASMVRARAILRVHTSGPHSG